MSAEAPLQPIKTLRDWRKELRELGRREFERRVRKRECGTCSQCCTTNSVPDVTAAHTPCEHLGGVGCRIYDRRPQTCAGYYCAWRLGFGRSADRPDRVGGHWEWHEKGAELMDGKGLIACFRMEAPGFNVDAAMAGAADLAGLVRCYLGVVTLELGEGEPFVCTEREHELRRILELAARGANQEVIARTLNAPPMERQLRRGSP